MQYSDKNLPFIKFRFENFNDAKIAKLDTTIFNYQNVNVFNIAINNIVLINPINSFGNFFKNKYNPFFKQVAGKFY